MRVIKFSLDNSLIELILCSILITACVYINSSYFVDKILFPKWMSFYFISGIIILYSSVYNDKIKYITKYDIIVICATLVMFIILLILRANNGMILLASILGLYISIKYKFNINRLRIVVSYTLMLIGIHLFCISINQMYNKIPIIGSYNSVVGLSLTLSFSLAATANIYRLTKRRIYKLLLIITYIALFWMLIIIDSRVGILSAASVTLVYFWRNIPNGKKWKIIGVVALFLILVIYHKSDSTLGRYFIYDTTISMMDTINNICFGRGESGFRDNYMTYQAMALLSESDEIKLLADNINHPLNELLYLIINFGIVFFAILCFVLMLLFKQKRFSNFDMSIIIILSIFALFSYPFRYPIAWIALLIVLIDRVKHISYDVNDKIMLTRIVYLICGIIISGYILMNAYLSTSYNHTWKMADKYALLGYIKTSKEIYENLESQIASSDFQYNYASFLLESGFKQDAMRVIENSNTNDYEFNMLRGRIQIANDLTTDALVSFEIASKMCPNRFMPLYEMYCIYRSNGDVVSKNKIAYELNAKQIKKRSTIIDSILMDINKK